MIPDTLRQPRWLTTATLKGGMLITSGRLYWEDNLREEITPAYDHEYGPGNWLIVPTDDLPDGFDPATYTIENGQFVPATDEVLDMRREAETARKAEEVRQEREARYRSQTDPLLFDAMEAYAIAHPQKAEFSAWLAAKNRIREELPKEPLP